MENEHTSWNTNQAAGNVSFNIHPQHPLNTYRSQEGDTSTEDLLSGYPYPSQYGWIHIILASVSVSVIILIIVVGNGLVVLAIFVDRNLTGLQHWFIASLAVSDLFVGLFIMPLSLANELMGYWMFGDVLCELWLATDVLLCTASILNLCLISLDRYWSITRAISYVKQRTKKRAGGMISFVWIASMVICLPPLVGWKRPQPTKQKYPLCVLSEEPGYVIYSIIGSFYLPLALMLSVYYKIYIAARSRARRNLKKKPAPPMRGGSRGTLLKDLKCLSFVRKGCNVASASSRQSGPRDTDEISTDERTSTDGIVSTRATWSTSSGRECPGARNTSSLRLKSAADTGDTHKLEIGSQRARLISENSTTLSTLRSGESLFPSRASGLYFSDDGDSLVSDQFVQDVVDASNVELRNCSRTLFSDNNNENYDTLRLDSQTTDQEMIDETKHIRAFGDVEVYGSCNTPLVEALTSNIKDAISTSIGYTELHGTLPTVKVVLNRSASSSLEGLGLNADPLNHGVRERKVHTFVAYETKRRKIRCVRAKDYNFRTALAAARSGYRKKSVQIPAGGDLYSESDAATVDCERAKRRLARTRERRATIVLGIVVASFVGCWLPFFVVYPISLMTGLAIPAALFSVIFWLGYVNSALNPIIYTIFNREFRQAFHRIVVGRRR